MNIKLYILYLLALPLAACQTKGPSYTISGTVSEKYKDGRTIYLMKKGPTKLDSTIIKNGKFTFTGRQDSTVVRFLFMPPKEGKGLNQSFYLENGHIIADIRNWKITGTPNNDAYDAFWSGYKPLSDLLNELEKKFRHSTTDKEAEEIRKQMDELIKKINEYKFNSIIANIDNLVVGRSLFLSFHYGLSIEQLKELVYMMPLETLKDPDVQHVIKQMETTDKLEKLLKEYMIIP